MANDLLIFFINLGNLEEVTDLKFVTIKKNRYLLYIVAAIR